VLVIRQRNKIIEETDQKRQGDESDLEDDAQKKLTPSVAAITQFLDYCK
jgi:replication fork protection complex subunit Tof1/Swi1